VIVVVGESLIDVVVDPDGDTSEEPGGSPLNVAVGLGRLDVPALLITEAGHDERGGRIVEHVRSSGAEIVVADTRDGRTATATAHIDRHGVATYDFAIGWHLPDQELPQCDALHVGSLGTHLEPGREQVLDLVEQAYGRDVFVSYDPNLRAGFVDDRAQVWRDVEALADHSALVKISDQDVALLHPEADPDDIARSLLNGSRTELVILTRGADGATAYVEDNQVHLRPEPITVVDTVGAGDAFMAGALAILFETDALGAYGAGLPRTTEDLERLLRGASEVASFTCRRRGANPPRRAEMPADWPG
jgi:fructokinase